MGPLVIMVVLVCGFWYTENHYPSRIRQERTDGWNAYFYVAMHGCKFAVQGFLLGIVIFIFLFFLSGIINLLGFIWPRLHSDIHLWLLNEKIMSYPVFVWISLLLAVFIAYEAGNKARKELEDENKRQAMYREMAAQDGIESLLVQAIDEDKLIFVTLKSRKVYIGYVAAPRIENSHTQHLAIIPYISGYRDKDTLRYHEQHRYYELYLSENITPDSIPLNLQHFRHVIPMEEVEAISLFDTATYKTFDRFSDGGEDVVYHKEH